MEAKRQKCARERNWQSSLVVVLCFSSFISIQVQEMAALSRPWVQRRTLVWICHRPSKRLNSTVRWVPCTLVMPTPCQLLQDLAGIEFQPPTDFSNAGVPFWNPMVL